MNMVIIAGGSFIVIQLTLVILSIILILRMGKVIDSIDRVHEEKEKEKQKPERFRYKKLQVLQGNNE